MELFLSLLPLFILGNLHCAAMCGPLVALLARHPYRWGYFLGRLVSFAFAGLLSSELGMWLFYLLKNLHLSALFSLFFGAAILFAGLFRLFSIGMPLPGRRVVARVGVKLAGHLSHLLSRKSFGAVFLFGLLTMVLPCGQTVVVFSACALEGNPLTGLWVGAVFALLTSPALIAVMQTGGFFKGRKELSRWGVALSVVVIGGVTCLRGLADLEYIPHVAFDRYHLVFF